MVLKIAVVGAGPNGLACAVKIKEKYRASKVVVISHKFTPDTTGDGSGGLWHPYLCGQTPDHLLTKWGIETYKYLHQRWLDGGSDVCLVPVIYLGTNKDGKWERPAWADHVFGYRMLTDKELQYFSKVHGTDYTCGHTFSTFILTPSTTLADLTKQFVYMGGEMVEAKVKGLNDPKLRDFDVVVNCSGLGARWIVPDTRVKPIRGQIVKVTAPWVHMAVLSDDYYILPNVSFCVMGGTHQENNYSTAVDENDRKNIFDGCTKILPTLQNAEVQCDWVGLRPGRHEIRLESVEIDGKLYIHNYGHGGSGLTLFWGCASEVLSLLDQHYKLALSKL